MTAEVGEPSDEHLVHASLAGDDDAFARLAVRHHSRVARMAWRFASGSHEAEDLVQEIFLQAWRKLRQYRGEVPFEHWLSRLALRRCYDLLRRRKRSREDTLDPLQWERLQTLHQAYGEPGPAWEFLELAMRQLSPEERMVVTLLELEEHTIREISSLTGWSEANVKVRAFRARQKLKTLLEETDESR